MPEPPHLPDHKNQAGTCLTAPPVTNPSNQPHRLHRQLKNNHTVSRSREPNPAQVPPSQPQGTHCAASVTRPPLFSGQNGPGHQRPDQSWCVFVHCVFVLLLAPDQLRPPGPSGRSRLLLRDRGLRSPLSDFTVPIKILWMIDFLLTSDPELTEQSHEFQAECNILRLSATPRFQFLNPRSNSSRKRSSLYEIVI